MAQALIFARNKIHVNPVKDRIGSYKKGYWVVVKDDGHNWGDKETLPDFYIVSLPKIPAAKLQKYTMNEMDGEDIYRRRRWRMKIEEMPGTKQAILNGSGKMTVKATAVYTSKYDMEWSEMKTYMLDQKTGKTETQDL